jgi:hypothetical protein
MTNLVIGDQMGMATLESCAEADALAPSVASVAPRVKSTKPTTFKTSDYHAMIAAGFTFSPGTMIWQHGKTGWKCSSEEVVVNGAEATIRRHQDTLTAHATNQAQQGISASQRHVDGHSLGQQFARPNLPIPWVDDKMLREMEKFMAKSGRKEPARAQSAYPRQCAPWCGLPFGDKRVDARFAFSATGAFDLESPAYCCPQRPEDTGL